MSPVVTGEDFDILTDEPFWEEVKKDVLRRLLPSFQKLLLAGVDFAEAARITYKALDEVLTGDKQLPMPVDYDALTTELLEFLPTYTDEWWAKLDVVTRDQLRASMTASVVAGESTEKLVKRLDPVFGPVRAERIAVTETTRLFDEGSRRTYVAAGVEILTWRSVHDNAVCPECEALDGEEWPIHEAPRAPLHVLCRCYLSPVVGKDLKPAEPIGEGMRAVPGELSAGQIDQAQRARTMLERSGDLAAKKTMAKAQREAATNIAKRIRKNPGWEDAVRARGRDPKDLRMLCEGRLNALRVTGTNSYDTLGYFGAAVEELGLATENLVRIVAERTALGGVGIADAAIPNAFERMFVREMYRETQEALAKAGIDRLVIHRGLRWDPGEIPSWAKKLTKGQSVEMDIAADGFYPVNSFALDHQVAVDYATNYGKHQGASVVMTTEVPVGQILSTGQTGVGAMDLTEFTVLSGPGKVTVVAL